jgi:hypothetical protein
MSKVNNKKVAECKKQHIVPQFLQNEFSSNGKLFRHTPTKSFGVNISDNYAENYYYSEVFQEKALQDKTLDKRITKAEGHQFVPTFQKLLTLDTQKEYFVDQEISDFIYHFFLRNKTIVKSIIEVIEEGINNLTSLRKESLDATIGLFIQRNLKEFALNNSITSINKQKILEIYPKQVYDMPHEVFLKEKFGFLREMHEKCLDSNTYLSVFKFQIVEGSFVLADTVLTCYNNQLKQNYLPIIDKNTEHVFFPISKCKMLVIYKNDYPEFDISEINKYLVSPAESFSSELPENDNSIIELKKHIGKTSFSIEIDDELEVMNQKYILEEVKVLEERILPALRSLPKWKAPQVINSRKKRKKK